MAHVLKRRRSIYWLLILNSIMTFRYLLSWSNIVLDALETRMELGRSGFHPVTKSLTASSKVSTISCNVTTSNRSLDTNASSNSEKRHIVFLKVHKAASSTVQSILLRFAVSRHLNALLDRRHPYISEVGPWIRRQNIVPSPPGAKFDILASHIIFNQRQIAPYFPASTVYIGIVREPFQLFKSAFIYYSQVWKKRELLSVIKKHPKNPMQAFLRKPQQFSHEDPRSSYVNNRMIVDFGFPIKGFEDAKKNPEKIEAFVSKIHQTFGLVLIADRFDESMVMLRRYLNWPLRNVLYLKSNVFNKGTNTSKATHAWINAHNFTQEDLDLFSSWAFMDIILYRRSLEIFESKIQKETDFQEEVKVFQKIQTSVSAFCHSATSPKNLSLLIRENRWTKPFKVSRKDCHIMQLEGVAIVDFTRRIQISRSRNRLKLAGR